MAKSSRESRSASKSPSVSKRTSAAATLRSKGADHPTTAKPASAAESAAGLTASLQVLPLPAGVYLFSVKSAPVAPDVRGRLALPAMHVGLGPGVRSEQVEFITGPSTEGAWLFHSRDVLVAKITGAGATLILNSVRSPGGETLSISVERLDLRVAAEAKEAADSEAGPDAVAALASGNSPRKAEPDAPKSELALQIGAHIRMRGDMTFSNAEWAGRVAPGLWIESYAVRPLEVVGLGDIEYKALTGTGFETPWISDGKMCGTKGMVTPLVGFAVRLKPGSNATDHDCEYSGYFRSAGVVGPMRNGAPCRSTVSGDALEGIQVRVIKRSAPRSAPSLRAIAGTSAKSGRRGDAQTSRRSAS